MAIRSQFFRVIISERALGGELVPPVTGCLAAHGLLSPDLISLSTERIPPISKILGSQVGTIEAFISHWLERISQRGRRLCNKNLAQLPSLNQIRHLQRLLCKTTSCDCHVEAPADLRAKVNSQVVCVRPHTGSCCSNHRSRLL